MEWTIKLLENPRIVVMRMWGKPKVDECSAALDDLVVAKGFLIPVLVDDRELDLSDLSPLEMFDIGTVLESYEFSLSLSRIAVLVGTDTAARIVEKLRAISLPPSNAGVRVFFEHQAALDWLTAS